MLSAEKIAYSLDEHLRAIQANCFNTILCQLMLNEVGADTILEYNEHVADFLYGTKDGGMNNIINFVAPLKLTATTKSIIDYHIWLLRGQSRDHFPKKTV